MPEEFNIIEFAMNGWNWVVSLGIVGTIFGTIRTFKVAITSGFKSMSEFVANFLGKKKEEADIKLSEATTKFQNEVKEEQFKAEIVGLKIKLPCLEGNELLLANERIVYLTDKIEKL